MANNNCLLRVLNLSGNNLDAESSLKLLKYAKVNYQIEELLVNNNPKIANATIGAIAFECRQNILITEYIMPKLPVLV